MAKKIKSHKAEVHRLELENRGTLIYGKKGDKVMIYDQVLRTWYNPSQRFESQLINLVPKILGSQP